MDIPVFDRFDWKLFIGISVIFACGIISLYSITYQQGFEYGPPIYVKQIMWGGVGYFLFFLFAFIEYRFLLKIAYFFYAVVLAMLVLVAVIGVTKMGAQRWLDIGPITIQPSEFAKLALPLALTKYFTSVRERGRVRTIHLIIPFILTFLYFILILKQPDLGTGLVIMFVFGFMILISGYRFKNVMIVLLFFAMVMPFFWEASWNFFLKDYQKKRILMFLNPSSDPLGSGYHILQSQISIGSGGLTGKGLFGGTQTQLKFLPEGHTDFIFSVFSEEWGFLGVILLLLLYIYILYCGVEAAIKSKEISGVFLSMTLIGIFFFNVIVNIGMTLAVLPVVGIPLPLMSYGGTSLITVMVCLGIVQNIRMKKFGYGYQSIIGDKADREGGTFL